MSYLTKDSFGCPPLFLAPMEGLGDLSFRRAMAKIGGFNEGCTEFLRVPSNAHVQSLAKHYVANQLSPIPQAVQLMGSDPGLMGAMTREVIERGAHRVDLNCGCPSNKVTGKGAGSSLLKEPEHLYKVARAMVEASTVPVSAKLRIGYEDTSLFKENLLAAQESGIAFLTLHPRTKADGYGPPARWEFITQAKQLLRIPVVGNGDILTVDDALRMLQITGCDGLMIGRGAVINPFIFLEIKSHYSRIPIMRSWNSLHQFLRVFMENIQPSMPQRNQISKLKQLFSFLFKHTPELEEKKFAMLRATYVDASTMLKELLPLLEPHFTS